MTAGGSDRVRSPRKNRPRIKPPGGGLGQAAGRCRRGGRHAGPSAPPQPPAQVRPAQLAHQDRRHRMSMSHRTMLEGVSAVEMPGPWKTWKTRPRFPTFPTAPWKSPQARFPHSHRAHDGSPTGTQKPTRHGSGPSRAHRDAKAGGRPPERTACRNHLRQGIDEVFWVGFLWPVLK